jgi:hypothetical protein
MKTRLMRIETDIGNMEMIADDGAPSLHNIKIAQSEQCRIIVRYKESVDVCSRHMPTVALHLSRHAKGIREQE